MLDSRNTTTIEVQDLAGWYGESQALHGISLNLREGEILTLLGRNGAGKSTTLKAIMGMLRRRRGSIRLRGEELIALSADAIARRGIAICPEHRGIFASLTVRENLALPPVLFDGGMPTERILDLFVNLRERLASPGTKLSGGEQQMLAIGRILRTGARILLIDEPMEGLAPVIVQQIATVLRELRHQGYTILLVEQNLAIAENLADRHYVVEHGRIVDEFDGTQVAANREKLKSYLGI